MHLRERIHLGIALHAVVNLGFALAVILTTVPLAAADASAAPIAFDPSPATLRSPTSGSAASTPSSRSSARRVRAATGERSGDRFDRLAQCESGGDASAVSPTGRYRGAFQFSRPTWRAAGGAGDPIDASYDEQKRIAVAWARVVEPSSQWPVCWSRTT